MEEQALAAALQVLAGAHPDDYKRIEKELSTLPSSAQKVRRLIRELSPGLEKRFRENEMN